MVLWSDRWEQFRFSFSISINFELNSGSAAAYLITGMAGTYGFQGHNGYYGNIFFFFVGFKFKGVVEKFLYRWNCFIKQGHFWDFTLEDHYKQFSIKNGRNGCRFAKSGIDKELWFVSKGWNFGEGHYGRFTSWIGLHNSSQVSMSQQVWPITNMWRFEKDHNRRVQAVLAAFDFLLCRSGQPMGRGIKEGEGVSSNLVNRLPLASISNWFNNFKIDMILKQRPLPENFVIDGFHGGELICCHYAFKVQKLNVEQDYKRLVGVVGKRPAATQVEEFTAGVEAGMGIRSGKVCQRQTPSVKTRRWQKYTFEQLTYFSSLFFFFN
ncbi:hypothetical protein LXL04_029216 [Taraxacum kok-saghyz]